MTDTTLNAFVASGPAANRAAFTPSPPTPASGPNFGYFWFETDTNDTYAWDSTVPDWVKVNSGGPGTVTTTGSPASGNLTKFSGTSSITNGDLSGDITTSGTLATTIANNAVTTAKINNSAVTLAKIANAAANSKLLGAGATGSGAPYVEITLGTNLSMSGTTLNASGGSSALVLITETVTSGSAANVSFTSIPSTYRDLEIRVRGRGSKSAGNAIVRVRFNGDTGSNYDFAKLDSFGGTPSGGNGAATTSADFGYVSGATAPTNASSSVELIVFDYKGTTFQKSAVSRGTIVQGTTTGNIFVTSGVVNWRSTSAITQVDVFPDSGNFIDGTVVSLYGRY